MSLITVHIFSAYNASSYLNNWLWKHAVVTRINHGAEGRRVPYKQNSKKFLNGGGCQKGDLAITMCAAKRYYRAAALELTSGALASEGTNERQNLETRSLTKEYYGKSLE